MRKDPATWFNATVQQAKQKAHKHGLVPRSMLAILVADIARGAVQLAMSKEELIDAVAAVYDASAKGSE